MAFKFFMKKTSVFNAVANTRLYSTSKLGMTMPSKFRNMYTPMLTMLNTNRRMIGLITLTSCAMSTSSSTTDVKMENGGDKPHYHYDINITKNKSNNLEEVVKYWNKLDIPTKFGKDLKFDKLLLTNFEQVHRDIMNGLYDEYYLSNPQHALAMILVLDQFSRNMFRDTPKAFASDEKALQIAKLSIEKGFQNQVDGNAMWFYLPFMHSENLENQQTCVDFFTNTPQGPGFARAHQVIIEKFGLFPHRNKILGRESTPEMLKFLEQDGSSF